VKEKSKIEHTANEGSVQQLSERLTDEYGLSPGTESKGTIEF
jgi:hypothetical protein